MHLAAAAFKQISNTRHSVENEKIILSTKSVSHYQLYLQRPYELFILPMFFSLGNTGKLTKMCFHCIMHSNLKVQKQQKELQNK